MKAMLWITLTLGMLAPASAHAVQVCFEATAAQVTRAQEAIAVFEVTMGRSYTNDQFVREAVRQFVVEILLRENQRIKAAEAEAAMNGVNTDFPRE